MILNCPFCKAKVEPTQQTCPACAKRMTRRCPACAEDIAVDMKTCKYCGEDATAPSPVQKTPGIEFIEADAPAPKKRTCYVGKALLTLGLLLGLATAAVTIRTDCVVCTKRAEHIECIATGHSVSHCGRKICRDGKTPLWATVFESFGGTVCSKHRASCCEGEIHKSPQGSDWQ